MLNKGERHGEGEGTCGRVGAKNVVSAVLMSALNFNCARRLSEFDNHLGHNRWIISFYRHHHYTLLAITKIKLLKLKDLFSTYLFST